MTPTVPKARPSAAHTIHLEALTAIIMSDFPECEDLLPEFRRICRGEKYGPAKTDTYRTKLWGLPPLNVPTTAPDDKEKPRGLGDTVAAFTKVTGIDRVVKAIAGEKGCGCGQRQAALNRLVPYR